MAAACFLDNLSDIVTRTKITADGETVLIDGAGRYIINKDAKAVLTKNIFDDWKMIFAAHPDLKTALIGGKEETTILDGRYICSAPVAGTPWHVVSSGSTESLTRPARRSVLIVSVIALALALLTALAALVLTRRITTPFTTLAHIFTVIARGDLTASSPDFSSKEASSLAAGFNQLVGSLRGLIRGVQGEAGKLACIGDNLTRAMNQTADSVKEITANIANIQTTKEQVVGQVARFTETGAATQTITDKLSQSIVRQNESVASVSAAIEQVLANIESVTKTLVKNSANVKNLSEASGVGQTGLREVAANIQEIAKESAGLMEINAVMENIASQTNLLSMNAAIEAAHAGEAGKGFAVVADEIRKLAENSGEQSKTIGAVLKKIKENIDKISGATANVLDKFQAIASGVDTVFKQEQSIMSAME
jgi:methyl-accepting chemotaxis protein